MAAGCYHSVYACPQAHAAVLGFRDRYKPEVVIDLGDVHDFAALRAGAGGTPDEVAPLDVDYDAGVAWLRDYRPTHRCHGNHDHRAYKLADHPRAIVKQAARSLIESIRQVDEANGTIVVPYKRRGNWITFGDTKFGHGFMFNAHAIRDHAEHFGKCVIAHLHTPGEARGRRFDQPTAWCVGTLADPELLEYADQRRNTDTWAHGFVWGEFSETQCVIRLERQACYNSRGAMEEWRLPI
jgi:hypothetical protein